MRSLGAVTIARVRQQASVGVLADAFGDESFCRNLATAIGRGGEMRHRARRASLRADARLSRNSREATSASLPVGIPHGHSSNSIVTLGERLFLKGYRRVRRGINPEVEIGRYLTDVAHFPNCVPLAGVVEHVDAADGAVTTLALLQAYVRNQGDGWTYTLEYLARFLDTQRAAVEAARRTCTAHISRSSRRSACAPPSCTPRFARATGDPAFDPEPAGRAGLRAMDATRAR